jgi:AraC-like DNA-binding protein
MLISPPLIIMMKAVERPFRLAASPRSVTGSADSVWSDFVLRMAPDAMVALFEGLEGVVFFVKDHRGCFVKLVGGPRQCLDFGPDEEITGLTDYDFYPRGVADRVRQDDARVMSTGKPMLNIVELLVNTVRMAIGWYVTNKFPVHDAHGQVIGVMGTVQSYDTCRRRLLTGTALDQVVECIRLHPEMEHSVSELAKESGMSVRQLRRRFQEVLGVSPRDFAILSRIKVACETLLNSSLSVAEIAQQTGFYDQSALAYQFRRRIGIAPLEYRNRHRASDHAAAKPGIRASGSSSGLMQPPVDGIAR